jgi:hypothetical protein
MSFGSCYYYGSAAYRRTARGGGTTMAVAKPAYNGSGGAGHSLDEIAVQGGVSDGNIVELGWNVSTAQYANSNPHLFVFHWIGWAPTCYDTCAWHQYNSTYAPGLDLSALVGHEVYVGWSTTKETGGLGSTTSGSATSRARSGRRATPATR